MSACGALLAEIRHRGGGAGSLGELDTTSISFDRRFKDMSQAEIGVSLACRGDLEMVEPWFHELWIFDQDQTDQPLWSGPVTSVADGKVTANDVSAWLRKRRLMLDHVHLDAERQDATNIWVEMWHDAMDQENPILARLIPSAAGVAAASDYKATQKRIAWDEMQNLAEVVDWYVVNRDMIAGSLLPLYLGDLLDEHVAGEPSATKDGWAMGTRVTMLGASSGDTDNPVSSGDIPAGLRGKYGLLDVVLQNDKLTSTSQVVQAAQQYAERSGFPVVTMSDVQLSDDAPWRIQQLRPGFIVQANLVDRTDFPITGFYMLTQVQVDGDGAGSVAKISVEPATNKQIQDSHALPPPPQQQAPPPPVGVP